MPVWTQDIYTCPPSVLPLNVRPRRETQRHEMPGVDGGFVLTDVLSAEECNELRKATEHIGAFLEDGVGWALFGKSRKIMIYLEQMPKKTQIIWKFNVSHGQNTRRPI